MGNSLFAIQFICDTPEKEEIVFRQLALPKYLDEILEKLKADPHALIFLNKVSKKDAPNYYDVIKHPMDLGTVAKKIPLYRGLADFKADLDLIWDNCLEYNTAEYFINCATEMRNLANTLMRTRDFVSPRVPEQLLYESTNIPYGRDKILHAIAKSLHNAGFDIVGKSLIDIICDAFEFKIVEYIQSTFKNEENLLENDNEIKKYKSE